MHTWVGVLGTHGWPEKGAEHEWWHPESPFAAWLRQRGLTPARPKPFVWSGDLQGVPLFGAGKDWQAGAAALDYYLCSLPHPPLVIAHSHGGAVALLCAAGGRRIEALVTVGTPVR
jgi:pimeloyl-ACP methyl ester carboxylesterase